MRSRLVHAVLVVLILVQPVVALAALPVSSVMSSNPEGEAPVSAVLEHAGIAAAVTVGEPGESTHEPCHGVAYETKASAGNCCDSMDSTACLFSCLSFACAVSTSASKDPTIIHIVVQLGPINSYLYQNISGIFHPPRSS